MAPRNPVSSKIRLDPLPRTRVGIPESARIWTAWDRESREDGVTKRSAGPPTSQVQWSHNGISRCGASPADSSEWKTLSIAIMSDVPQVDMVKVAGRDCLQPLQRGRRSHG